MTFATVCFIFVGLIVGFLQYALIKTAVLYMEKEKSGVFGVITIKLLLYGILAAVLLIWFDTKELFACVAGVATGIIITAVSELIRKKKGKSK